MKALSWMRARPKTLASAAGVTVAENPSVIGETVARVMAKRAA